MRKTAKFAWVCASILFFIIIIWGYQVFPQAYAAADSEIKYCHQGWSQIIDGVTIELDDIQNYYPVEEGESLIFTCTLQNIHEGDVFLLYSYNQEVYAYVDGVCIHDFSMQDGFEFLGTPGSAWNQIDLTLDMIGQTFQLEFSSDVTGYTNQLSNIYLLDDGDVISVRNDEITFQAILAILLGILFLFTFLNFLTSKKETRRTYFGTLGNLYLIVLLWLLAELNAFELITHRPLIGFLLSMIFIHTIPIILHQFISRNYNGFPRISRILEFMVWLNLFLPFILQFTLHISLLDLLWVNALVCFLNICYYIALIVNNTMLKKDSESSEFPILLIGIIIFGFTMDLVFYSYFTEVFSFFGISTFISCQIYAILSYIFFKIQDRDVRQENFYLADSNQKLQTASLMEQIKAHFIFNTLNTISYLCKHDAKKANHAVLRFSAYLRSYMYLINTTEIIPFNAELSLIESYLDIEKMRFGSKFHFALDIQYQDFKLPPLSLQPLIENAMIHGIRKAKSGNHIALSTMLKGNIIEIIVEDSGVGFDTSILDSEKGIGFANLKKRIELMVQGDVHIKSEVGCGTIITIHIPIKKRSAD